MCRLELLELPWLPIPFHCWKFDVETSQFQRSFVLRCVSDLNRLNSSMFDGEGLSAFKAKVKPLISYWVILLSFSLINLSPHSSFFVKAVR